MMARLLSCWAFTFLIFSLCILATSLYSSQVACPFFQRWSILFFSQSLSKGSLFSQASLLPHQFVLWHMGTCSYAFKNSFLKDVQLFCTPVPQDWPTRNSPDQLPQQLKVRPPEVQGSSFADLIADFNKNGELLLFSSHYAQENLTIILPTVLICKQQF